MSQQMHKETTVNNTTSADQINKHFEWHLLPLRIISHTKLSLLWHTHTHTSQHCDDLHASWRCLTVVELYSWNERERQCQTWSETTTWWTVNDGHSIAQLKQHPVVPASIGVASHGALGHVPPLDFQLFFSVNFKAAQSNRNFVRLPLQTCILTAAAVVQSWLH